jgi:uncharacterized protein YndB with AHSA1/START domain
MPDIISDVVIKAAAKDVFRAISTPAGLDTWWTKTSAGDAKEGAEFELGFGAGTDWHARVTTCRPNAVFELEIFDSDPDWNGTRVAFRVTPRDGRTWLTFSHIGWPEANEHWRVSCYCWQAYLRLLRRNLEHGELVPYESRLDV